MRFLSNIFLFFFDRRPTTSEIVLARHNGYEYYYTTNEFLKLVDDTNIVTVTASASRNTVVNGTVYRVCSVKQVCQELRAALNP